MPHIWVYSMYIPNSMSICECIYACIPHISYCRRSRCIRRRAVCYMYIHVGTVALINRHSIIYWLPVFAVRRCKQLRTCSHWLDPKSWNVGWNWRSCRHFILLPLLQRLLDNLALPNYGTPSLILYMYVKSNVIKIGSQWQHMFRNFFKVLRMLQVQEDLCISQQLYE